MQRLVTFEYLDIQYRYNWLRIGGKGGIKASDKWVEKFRRGNDFL
jgi:hypothetical protein